MQTILPNNLMVISDADVRERLTHVAAYQAVKEAFLCHHAGDFQQPLKPYVRPGGREGEYRRGRLITMPAYIGGTLQSLGAKLIAGFPINVERGLPRANGLTCLFDPETGVPLAVMDCQTLSARRTAAVAALCVDHFATLNARRIGILGAGPIAKEFVGSLLSVDRNIERICLFDPREDRVGDLVDCARQQGRVEIVTVDSAETCVRMANVVVTATTGTYGYLKRAWLSGDWLLVALSLDDCEPEVLLAADKVVCDDFEQSNREEKLLHRLTQAGRFRREDLYAEIGEVVAGSKQGREGRESIYANTMGQAVEDLAVAQYVYRDLSTHQLKERAES